MFIPTEVRKIEFHTGIRGWKIASAIHKMTGSTEASEHVATFSVEEGNSEIMSVKAVMNTKGRMFRNMIIHNEVAGTVIKLCMDNIILTESHVHGSWHLSL